MAKIADVVIKVITKDLDAADKKLKKVKNSTDDVTKSSKGLSSFTKAGVVGAAIVGIGLLTDGLKNATVQSVKFADNIGKSAEKLGLTTDELQRFRIHAVAAGLSIQEFDDAYQRFLRRTGEVKRGTGELKAAFDELGVTVKTDGGQIKTNSQLYEEFTEKLKGVSDHTIQMSLAFKAFDIAGAKVLTMIRQSADETARINDLIERYGLILDKDVIRKAEEAATQLGILDQAHQVAMANAMTDLMPVVAAWNDFKVGIVNVAGELAKAWSGDFTLTARQELKLAQNALDAVNEKQEGWAGKFKDFTDEKTTALNRLAAAQTKVDAEGAAEEEIKAEKAAMTAAEAAEKERLENAKFFAKEMNKLRGDSHNINLGNILDEKEKVETHNAWLIEQENLRIDAMKVSDEQKIALKDQYLSNILQAEFQAIDAIIDREEQAAERKAEIDEAVGQREAEANKTRLDRATEYYSDLGQVIADSTVGWADRTAGAMIDMARTGEDNWRRLADSIIDDIGRIILKQQILNAMQGVAGMFSPTPASSSPVGGSVAGTSNVDVGFSPTTFARGGVVSSFTRSGDNVGGEAGPEGILPLKRDEHGNLGVVASGGNGGMGAVNIKVINNTQAEVKQETSVVNGERQITFIVEEAIGAMVQNGRFDKFMNTYGGNRRGVR